MAAAGLIAIALTIGALSLREDSSQHSVDKSRVLSRVARRVLALALDAETGARGYLVTHDRRSLEPQIAAEPQLIAALDSLVMLSADDSAQTAMAASLRSAGHEWIDQFERPEIAAAPSAGGKSKAFDLAGKPLFDVIRGRAEQFASGQDSLYASRLNRGRRERWAAAITVSLELLALLAVISWLIRQNMAGTHELEEANAQLAEVVARAQEAQARAESEAQQKARLAALLDSALSSAPVGFAFFDRQLRFLRVNDTFAQLTGLAPADHIGQSLFEIDTAVARQVEPRLRTVLESRAPMVNVEYRMMVSGYDEIRNLLSSYYPITTPDGELFGIGAAVMDVTDLKALEEQLLQAQKMEAVGRLAGGVAHDFNNLLTVISSYAELILFDPAMQGREEIAEIRGATARAAKLTRQLLAFSRRQAMEPRIVNPNDVLRGVETMLRRLIDGNINILMTLSPDTPLIRVDPSQLEQVVMNLAINAADAMPEGGTLAVETAGVELDREFTKTESELEPGDYAVIRVRDTGHGMDEETRAQIFEPFFTTKEPGRGTGLGLSTAYGIVKQSSGTIAVASEPGVGSEFAVYLPAVRTETD
jgi:PAS domain S-box-containing protein